MIKLIVGEKGVLVIYDKVIPPMMEQDLSLSPFSKIFKVRLRNVNISN